MARAVFPGALAARAFASQGSHPDHELELLPRRDLRETEVLEQNVGANFGGLLARPVCIEMIAMSGRIAIAKPGITHPPRGERTFIGDVSSRE